MRPFNPFLPTVPTFAVREADVSRTANVETVGMNGLSSDLRGTLSVECVHTAFALPKVYTSQ